MPYKRNDAVAESDKVDLGGTVSNSTMTIRHRGQSVKGKRADERSLEETKSGQSQLLGNSYHYDLHAT